MAYNLKSQVTATTRAVTAVEQGQSSLLDEDPMAGICHFSFRNRA